MAAPLLGTLSWIFAGVLGDILSNSPIATYFAVSNSA